MARRWRESDPFDRAFDLEGFERLKEYARCAFHECNLGNQIGWYGHFRSGYTGLCARLYGVRLHYRELHAWTPRKRKTEEMDYHLATLLFGMDSAVECCTYALNALGCAIAPVDFHNVSDDAALRRIFPENILGRRATATQSARQPLPGYAAFFPQVQAYWQRQRALLDAIMAQHDASKHRMATILDSLQFRDDPPAGFWEELGITDDFEKQVYTPRSNFLIDLQVKGPNTRAQAGRGMTVFYLEELAKRFRAFIKKTGDLADQDAKAHIPLAYTNAFEVNEAERALRKNR